MRSASKVLDLFGLSEENRLLIGQTLLSKLQVEMLRRELSANKSHSPFYLYADEFQSFAGVSEGTWRELLSRGRKYGLCLTLAHQYPAQLPTGLQDEILGNVNSILAFGLGGKDAQVMRREFLQRSSDRADGLELIPEAALIDLSPGEAYAKVAGGHAIKIRTPAPLRTANVRRAEDIVAVSWTRYMAPYQHPSERNDSPRPSLNSELLE